MKEVTLKIIQVTDGFEIKQITTVSKTLTIVPKMDDAKAIVNYLNSKQNQNNEI